MKRECTVSVIVPVYNAERYLVQCIESVLEQKFTNWELLLVNDGSTDDSETICREYALRDERIIVIQTTKKGVGHARNVGLDNACGAYVMFLDADDYLLTNALEFCLQKIELSDCDIVCAECQPVKENGGRFAAERPIFADELLPHEDYLKKVLTYSTLCAIWAKLYRRELLDKVRFDESMTRGQDVMFLYSLLSTTEGKCLISCERIYRYRILQQSASHGKSIEQIEKLHFLIQKFQEAYRREVNFHAYLAYAICFSLNEIMATQGWVKQLSTEDHQLFVSCYRAYCDEVHAERLHSVVAKTPHCLLSIVASLCFVPSSLKKIIRKMQ